MINYLQQLNQIKTNWTRNIISESSTNLCSEYIVEYSKFIQPKICLRLIHDDCNTGIMNKLSDQTKQIAQSCISDIRELPKFNSYLKSNCSIEIPNSDRIQEVCIQSSEMSHDANLNKIPKDDSQTNKNFQKNGSSNGILVKASIIAISSTIGLMILCLSIKSYLNWRKKKNKLEDWSSSSSYRKSNSAPDPFAKAKIAISMAQRSNDKLRETAAESILSLTDAVYAVHPFFARRDDELSLKNGDLIQLHLEFDDGWALGSNVMDQTIGVFPMVCVMDPRDYSTGDSSTQVVIPKRTSSREYSKPTPPTPSTMISPNSSIISTKEANNEKLADEKEGSTTNLIISDYLSPPPFSPHKS